MDSDFAFLGAHLPDKYRAPSIQDVWPEHWPALQVFLDCETQWRLVPVGMGGIFYQGLDYTAVESVMHMHAVDDTRAMLRMVKTIERGALEVINRD